MLAGGVGALSRYGLAGLAQRWSGSGFPVGTFTVNVLGCFLFGLVWGLLEGRLGLAPQLRLIVLTGFMGSFTTFSTFVFESVNLMQSGQWGWLVLNIVGQNVVGVLLLMGGLAAARVF